MNWLLLVLVWLVAAALVVGVYIVDYVEKYVPKDKETGLPVILRPKYRYTRQEEKKNELIKVEE